jgi:aryl-alcohol dehydrogenase-like predicted oxidoreductase
MVQFAWWNYAIPGYLETAYHLSEMQKQGKIRFLGVTNVNGKYLKEMLEAGIPLVTNQVQYSVLDHRPEYDLKDILAVRPVRLLCYGVLAGGFLSERYLNTEEPAEPLENRSLVKYKLIIDEFGGYDLFQRLLEVLQQIASKHQVGIAEVASRYVLQKPHVAGIIIGARNPRHIGGLQKIHHFFLDEEDLEAIHAITSLAKGPSGAVYELESDKDGRHGRIMRYNLNQQRSGSNVY